MHDLVDSVNKLNALGPATDAITTQITGEPYLYRSDIACPIGPIRATTWHDGEFVFQFRGSIET